MSDQMNGAGLGQPPPNAAPVATPPQGRLGDIIRVALPLVAAAAAGSNPALARGVNAAGNIMDLQSTIADRQQRLAMEKMKNDLYYRSIQGLGSYYQGGESPLLSQRVKSIPEVANPPADLYEGASAGGGDEATAAPQGRLQDVVPPVASVDPLVARQLQGLHDQGRIAYSMGDFGKAKDLALQAAGMKAAMSPAEAQGIPLQPGSKATFPTALGPVERTVAEPKWTTRNEPVIAPPGARGPLGEDLSGRTSYQMFNASDPNAPVKYLGEAQKTAFDLWHAQHPGADVYDWLAHQPAMYRNEPAPIKDELVQDIDPATGKVIGSHWENPVTHARTEVSGVSMAHPPANRGPGTVPQDVRREQFIKEYLRQNPDDEEGLNKQLQIYDRGNSPSLRQGRTAANQPPGQPHPPLGQRQGAPAGRVQLKPNFVYRSKTHPGKTFTTDSQGYPPPGE